MNYNSTMWRRLMRLLMTTLVVGGSFAATWAQIRTVTGKITSKEDGSGMPGVNIVLKGSQKGSSSNGTGNYSMEVTGNNPVLVFSFVGYSPVEVPVGTRSVIDVSMEPGIETLQEVVVTALGISREKRSLAFSVGELKSEDIVKAGNPNLMKSLDGKVSGVNLTNISSDPTSSVLVNIRGTSAMPTLSNANVSLKGQPLYVINGIPVGTQSFTNKDGVDFGNILSQLNPEDIASVTILKGGSAGALYGAEGGNGVVMITTKSGAGLKKGIGVSFTTSATADKAYQFFPEQTGYGQGERAYEWQYDNTDTWGPKLDGKFSADYWDVAAKQWKNGPMLSANEDRVRAYLRTGNTMTNTVSVTGNYDKGSFRFSVSDMNNKGVMPNTKTDQKSFSLNSTYNLTKDVRVSVSGSYIKTFSPNKANTTGSNSVLNDLLFNIPANLQPLDQMRDYWMPGFAGIRQNGAIMKDNGIDVAQNNPWWLTYEKIHKFARDNYFGKVQLDWQLTKPLSFMLRTGMQNVREDYELRQSWGAKGDAFGQFVSGNSSNIEANTDAILTYNNNFGRWSVTVAGGGNYRYTNAGSMEIVGGDLSSPALFTLGNIKAGTLTANGNPYLVGKSESLYGTANVGYNNQVFLEVTGRNDWKGAYAQEKISYFYPSASLSWVLSETVKLPSVFNLVKARLNYADVGNGLVRRRSIDTYSYDASPWGAINTVSLNASIVDPNLKAQHSVSKEIGTDIWMLNNRIKFDFTYFVKDQKDQIDNIPLVQGTGYTGLLTNIGDVRNKGFEWGLNFTPIKTKDLTWDVSASFTHYKATITRLSDKFAPAGYVFASYDGKTKVKIAEGEVIGSIYEENPVLRVKTGKYAGMPLLDGDEGKIQKSGDERDRGKLGNFNPDFILGLNTTLKYKQFTLGLVGSLRKGGKYVSVNQQYAESNGRAVTTLGSGPNNPYWVGGRDAENGGLVWPAEGASEYKAINNNNDDKRSNFQDASYVKGVFLNPNYTGDPAKATDADYIVNGADPKNTFYDFPYNGYGDIIWNFSATRTYDATNFKMREITLAYTLPRALTTKYNLSNVTFALIGRNVFQWNASGRNEDPESAFSGVGTNQGILRATLPSIRSYGFKLSLDF
ncbi:SusC/RagA family TonB-linked outer membrane protein [Runella slithyformis]|uniref:TonB-dependent receptor plug n=1 Tax=Runella slithyformis (strain ATCC 29530 / DSM 19594 / LMG 11500 / NCIMB 11436 / LSU 4) TaxID=761193 RepID=A0A7U4E6A8_RUNSL|nr:SusC/RagA family TonB-linked outer membrane protein [Runella slithyformis]AEI49134.1 TonB-dependent receptor plug [Runella slithyformis DSM 19594]